MFGATEPLDTRDATPIAAPAINGHVRGDDRDKAKPVSAGTADDSGPDWAAVLIRIRDHRDEASFVALFRHFAPRVKAFLMRSGADAAQAEECVQDVMATVWQKAAQFDPARASAATWIFTIARNRRIDALRKQKRPEPEDLPWGPEAEPDQEDRLGLQQETEHLGEALASLPAKQRELIEKAYFGDLTHSEIAEATGLPLGTIKSRIRLALQRLRHAMDRK
ncbi:sigma-70 family RNA polymerase sigma factor [Mameliella sp.]|uniref:sigma-70 family RNA polymerase sigma factor n=1 Tax=Mameliella sp. TaxID=1924940 RepID=UPI003B514A86